MMMSVFCCCKRPQSPSSRPEYDTRLPAPPPPAKLVTSLATPTLIVAPPIEISSTNISSTVPPVHLLPGPSGVAVEHPDPSELVDDDSDGDGDMSQRSRTKSLGTLSFVKTRLRRHLSTNSMHRRCRTSIGQSEEEVARRAELRRLMHRRIQEELQHEDTSISMSERRSAARYSVPYNEELPGGGPRDKVEFSVVEPVDGGDLGEPLPPKEGKKRRVQSASALSNFWEPSRVNSRRASCPEYFPAQRGDSSCSGLNGLVGLKDQVSLPQLHPLSPGLPVPVRIESVSPLGPLHSASAGSPARKWLREEATCRSVTATPVGVEGESPDEQKREEDYSHSLPHPQHVSTSFSSTPEMQASPDSVAELQDQSPLSTWLRSQGIYSRPQSPTASATDSPDEEDEIHEAHVVTLARPTSSIHDVDRVRVRDVTLPRAIHLYDMDIHRQLKPRGLSTPTASPTRLQTPGVHLRGPSLATQVSRISSLSLPPAIRAFCATGKENSLETSPQRPSNESISSIYDPSPMNSPRRSAGRTFSSVLPSHSTAGRFQASLPRRECNAQTGVEVVSDRRIVSSQSGDLRPRLMSIQNSLRITMHSPSIQSLRVLGFRGKGHQSSPISASETSSLQHQAAEERGAEQRDQEFHLRRGLSTNTVGILTDGCGGKEKRLFGNKSAFFSKLHLAIPKRVRHTSRVARPGDLAGPRWSSALENGCSHLRSKPKRNQSSRGASFQSQSQSREAEESVAEAWHRAIRAEAQQRGGEARTTGSQLPRRSTSEARMPNYAGPQQDNDSSRLRNGSLMIEGAETAGLDLSPTNTRFSQDEDDSFHHSVEQSWRALGEWTQQLHEQEARAKERSRSIVQPRSASKSRGIAGSWAKFPSHTRAQRAGPARPPTDTHVRGLAIRSVSAASGVCWSTAKDPHDTEPSPGPGHRALTNKFGKALKASFGKIMPGKQSSSADAEGSKCRRSSHHTGGDLEFPELEMFPTEGGYRELRALGREAAFLKGAEFRHGREPKRLARATGDKDQSNFSTKMASVLHLDGGSDHGDETLTADDAHHSLSSHRSSVPVTPDPDPTKGIASHTQESASTDVDRWETPLSRMSIYDDAVSVRLGARLQDLDRNADVDSVKSDTTVVCKARSCTAPNLAELRSRPTKFKTWSGRAKTQPVLMKSTLEFGAELERMLHRERERARGLGCSFEATRVPSKEWVVSAA